MQMKDSEGSSWENLQTSQLKKKKKDSFPFKWEKMYPLKMWTVEVSKTVK